MPGRLPQPGSRNQAAATRYRRGLLYRPGTAPLPLVRRWYSVAGNLLPVVRLPLLEDRMHGALWAYPIGHTRSFTMKLRQERPIFLHLRPIIRSDPHPVLSPPGIPPLIIPLLRTGIHDCIREDFRVTLSFPPSTSRSRPSGLAEIGGKISG